MDIVLSRDANSLLIWSTAVVKCPLKSFEVVERNRSAQRFKVKRM